MQSKILIISISFLTFPLKCFLLWCPFSVVSCKDTVVALFPILQNKFKNKSSQNSCKNRASLVDPLHSHTNTPVELLIQFSGSEENNNSNMNKFAELSSLAGYSKTIINSNKRTPPFSSVGGQSWTDKKRNRTVFFLWRIPLSESRIRHRDVVTNDDCQNDYCCCTWSRTWNVPGKIFYSRTCETSMKWSES